MFKYPISNRDLLRSVIVKITPDLAEFDDPVLRQFQIDQVAGLCTMEIVKGPEIKRTVTCWDPNRNCWREVTETRQEHFVEVVYADPEIEMLRKLAM